MIIKIIPTYKAHSIHKNLQLSLHSKKLIKLIPIFKKKINLIKKKFKRYKFLKLKIQMLKIIIIFNRINKKWSKIQL